MIPDLLMACFHGDLLILINYILLIRNTIQSVVPLYGQCGGIEYTGSTDCGTLGQCVLINSYYLFGVICFISTVKRSKTDDESSKR